MIWKRFGRKKSPGLRKMILKRMNGLLFNRFLAVVFLVILLIAPMIKIHSELAVPEERDWNYHQLQRINSTQDNFSFVVFGDNRDSVKTFENLIESVNKKNVTFAIACGDMISFGEEARYRFFIDQIKKLNTPLLTVVGNHDIEGNGREVYHELFGAFYYSFTIGNSYFIVLDNADGRDIDSRQMMWLNDELRKSLDFKIRFVFMHVPLFDPRKGSLKVGHSLSDLSFAKELNALFDENNVTMLFCSHIHGYYRGTWGKTPYIITGGAGAQLSGSDKEHDFHHYIGVSVSQNGVEYEVVKVKGQDLECLGREINHVWINVYAFFAIYLLESVIGMSLFYQCLHILSIKYELIVKRLGFSGMVT